MRTLRWLDERSRLVLGSDDGSVVEWDLAESQRTRSLAPHASPVAGLCLPIDARAGQRVLLTGSHDGCISVWAWQPEISLEPLAATLHSADESAGSPAAVPLGVAAVCC